MEPESQPLNPTTAEGTPSTDTQGASVILPPDAAPAPEASPPEPLSEYSDEEYGALLTSQGLGEFSGDARVLHGLRRFDSDYNTYLDAHAAMLASLPPGSHITPAPALSGQALEDAISSLTERYFSGATPSQRQRARPLMEASVQAVHRLTQALAAGDQVLPTVKAAKDAKLEAVALQRARQDVSQMSQEAFDGAYSVAWRAWKTADDAGDTLGKQLANAEMDRLMRGRYDKR